MSSTWLDLLPQNILTLITRSISRNLCPDLCTLATLSLKVKESCCAAVNYTLEGNDPEEIDAHCDVIEDTVRTVVAFRVIDDKTRYHQLLAANTLRTATIWESTQVYEALGRGGTCQDLTMHFNDDATSPLLADLLRKLPLKRLTLSCYVHRPVKRSLSASPLVDPESDMFLAKVCPQLEYLQVTSVKDNTQSIFWKLVRHFKHLKQLDVMTRPRMSLLEHLRNIENVRILRRIKDSVYFAEQLSSSVTSFCTNEVLEEVEYGVLQACSLQELHISVRPEHIDLLKELIARFPELTQLKLNFSSYDDYTKKRKRGAEYDSYETGTMFNLVKGLSCLESLGLIGVCVDEEELVDIVKATGNQLRVFETCIKGQPEPLFDRLELILKSLLLYNRRIEALRIWESWSTSNIKQILNRKVRDFAKKRRQQREQGKRLTSLVEHMKRTTDWQHTEDINRVVRLLL